MSDTLADVPLLSDLAFADLHVGSRWGPFVEPLPEAVSAELRGALGGSRPGADAPPGALPLLTLRVLRRALRGIIPGGVLARQHFSVVDRLPAGGDVEIDVWVSAQARWPSGLATTFTFTLRRDDLVRAVVEWTILAPDQEARP